MISLKFLKQATLFSLLVIALGGCAKESDPCSSTTPNEEPLIIGLNFQLWDNEKQAFYTKPLAYIDYHIWEAGRKVTFANYAVGASDTVMHLVGTFPTPLPEKGENVYYLPFVIKFPEYEEADSVSVVAYLEESQDCQTIPARYEYYLNGEFVHESSPWQSGITITKP